MSRQGRVPSWSPWANHAVRPHGVSFRSKNLLEKHVMQVVNRSFAFRAATAVVMMVAMAGSAMAGSADAEFNAILQKLVQWSSGNAGKALAIVSFLVGVMAGIARTTFIPVVAGLGFALAMNFGPGIITGLITAVI